MCKWSKIFSLGLLVIILSGSPAPQFESNSCSALSLLYAPALVPAHDYWKNHSFDYRDLCWQSDISAFLYCLGLS